MKLKYPVAIKVMRIYEEINISSYIFPRRAFINYQTTKQNKLKILLLSSANLIEYIHYILLFKQINYFRSVPQSNIAIRQESEVDKRDAEFRVRFSRAMKAGELDIPKTSVIHLLGEETGCFTFISIHLLSANVISTCVPASPCNPRAKVHSIELAEIGISQFRIYPSSSIVQ